ncbi:Gfo/Idh/MocA family protein [Paenibacillus caseinilyticus]|uniref:Oxidoreductase n=1 Tax=Paenibacillus mucilaginosus K02 TaxID=997761 RepID=I0BKU3_9BACL|nr:Gfo/Idh/MocA family oxidoreductase [Paenibacillus mucilaginosus]AFH62990.1 oxidoreductase [Paenibacillus mucilaginosus K02]WFA19283.1 Gfo/Idh/MocA family oxidoreductase [Paenibacillus mucilaginosus]
MREPQLDYKPKLPQDRSMGIAIVGAGEIVASCHLPAYRMAGFRVVGIYDIDGTKAGALAQQYEIPKVYSTLSELLDDEAVSIVDIAVPAKHQLQVVKEASAAGKHLLCQKPLSEDYRDAESIATLCEQAGIRAAVNQQMRWSPGIRASRAIMDQGWLGVPLQASIQVNVKTDWESWPWITKIPRLEVLYHSIHYLDSIRFLFGKPEYVYADGARYPGQTSLGETRTLIHIKFAGEGRALIHDNHNNWADPEDWYATFRFEGTEGIIKGTNGALYNYPHGREDTMSYCAKALGPKWFHPELEGRWFPHAFMGTMGELMRAVEEEREPENSVRDNLQTLQMVFAAYRSMEENRPVDLEEIERGTGA